MREIPVRRGNESRSQTQFHQLAQSVESWRLYQPRSITHDITPRSVHANSRVWDAAGVLSVENRERCLNPWNCEEEKKRL